jgi:predicted Ser/Thr protein kinase
LLAGKVNIRKLETYAQDDPDAYSYSGGLCLANRGLLEFVEMFKAPIKVLHPLLTATQEGNFKGSEGFGAIPFDGVVLAHSNEGEWKAVRNNKTNEATLDRASLNGELEKIEKPAGIANPKDFRNEIVNFALRARAARCESPDCLAVDGDRLARCADFTNVVRRQGLADKVHHPVAERPREFIGKEIQTA